VGCAYMEGCRGVGCVSMERGNKERREHGEGE